jgi:hypothetical protein
MDSELMVQVLQFGFGCGLKNRFEMIYRYCHAYPERMSAVIVAATEFEKGCCYCPEQEMGKVDLTPEQFKEWLFREFQCPTPTKTQ